jgi:hypothetical protein
MDDIMCCGKSGGVAREALLARLNQFATLATQLDSLYVSTFPHDCHACHVCHAEIASEQENYQSNQSFVESQRKQYERD